MLHSDEVAASFDRSLDCAAVTEVTNGTAVDSLLMVMRHQCTPVPSAGRCRSVSAARCRSYDDHASGICGVWAIVHMASFFTGAPRVTDDFARQCPLKILPGSATCPVSSSSLSPKMVAIVLL